MTQPLLHHTLENVESLFNVAYNDGRIALIGKMHTIPPARGLRLGLSIMTLCTQGTARLCINGLEHSVKEHNLLICSPECIFESLEMSPDFDMQGIVISRDYSEWLSMMFGSDWNVRLFLDRHPVIVLNKEENDLYSMYYNLLISRLTYHKGTDAHKLADALLKAFFHDFQATVKRPIDVTTASYTSGERMFHDFISLISNTYPRPRSVAWYAGQLHVTPKYLSSIIKDVSGETASTIIRRYIIADTAYLLRYTRKSIKEITNELNFPNISFFGKFVRRYLGQSPKQFRLSFSES